MSIKVDVGISDAVPKKLFRKMNRASIFTLEVPNESGKNTYKYYPGEEISVKLGFEELDDEESFIGFIPPTGIEVDAKPSNRKVRLTVVDYSALLGYERTCLNTEATYTNYDGWECSTAIKHLVNNLKNTPLKTYGIKGTKPQQFIETSDNIYSNYDTKLSVLNSIVDLCFDDTEQYPLLPLTYFWYVRGDGFNFRKQKQLSLSKPVCTIRVGEENFISAKPKYRPLINVCTAISKTDSTLRVTYSDKDSIKRWNCKFESKIEINSENLDTLQAYAKRIVAINKFIQKSLEIITRKFYWLYPGDVTKIEGAERWGIPDGNYEVKEVEIDMDKKILAKLRLAGTPKLLTEYL